MASMSVAAARVEIEWLVHAVVLALEADDEATARRLWQRMSSLIDHLRSLDDDGVGAVAEAARRATAEASAREATRDRLLGLVRDLAVAEDVGDGARATQMQDRIDIEEERLLAEAHLRP